jgi:PKD repeat protein
MSARHRFRLQSQQVINLASVAASVQVLGAAAGAHLRNVVLGDFNGDGLMDVAIAAPDATATASVSDVRPNAGVVYVIFGRNSLPSIIDGAPGALNRPDVVLIGGAANSGGDHSGAALAVADLNGDGRDDLIIGAPGASFPGSGADPARPNTGAVFVLFGQALSQGAIIDLNAGASASVAIYGNRTGDRFGSSLAAGDVGGLPLKDLVVGAPSSAGEGGSSTNAGAAYLVYGSPTLGSPKIVDLGTTPPGAIIYGQAGTSLGTSVAIGDVDGDGVGDILLGAPMANRPTAGPVAASTGCGAVYGVYGGTNLARPGAPIIFQIDSSTPASRPLQSVSVYGRADNDHMGTSVVSGDVTGDGRPDLILGAPDADGPGGARTGGGEVYLVAGGAAFVPAIPSFPVRLDIASGAQQLTIYGSAAGDHLGSFVGVGTYTVPGNTSRVLGIMAGAPFANSTNGTLSLFFGGPSLTFTSQRDLALNQDDLRVLGQNLGDELGWSAATGNIDGRKGSDLVLTAPFSSPSSRSSGGTGYVLLSSTSFDNLPPTVSITANPTTGVAPLTVNFMANASDPDGSIVSYAWQFGDSSTSSIAAPSHIFTTPGTYAVKVVVTDDGGATAQATALIQVTNVQPISVTIAANPASGPPPLNVSFTPAVTDPTGGSITSYAWDFGDGNSSTQQNVSHSFTTAGNFAVRLTVTDNHGTTGVGQTSISVVQPLRPPSVNLVSPNGGEAFTIGSALTVNWTAADPDGDNTIQSFDVLLSTDSGGTFSLILSMGLPGTARSASWNIPFTLTTNQARVKVIAHNNAGLTGQATSAANFTIVDPGIPVKLTGPSAKTLVFGQTVTISWQVTGASQPLVRGFDLMLSTDGGQTFNFAIAANPNGPEFGPTTFQFTWTVPAICTDSGRVLVVATSLGGMKTTDASPANISIHGQGPTVVGGAIQSSKLQFSISDGDGAIAFEDGATVQVSTDAQGTAFLAPDAVKLHHSGRVLITKGRFGGAKLQDFLPDGAIRIVRFTNPSCGVTVLQLLRDRKQLILQRTDGSVGAIPAAHRRDFSAYPCCNSHRRGLPSFSIGAFPDLAFGLLGSERPKLPKPRPKFSRARFPAGFDAGCTSSLEAREEASLHLRLGGSALGSALQSGR